MDYLHETSKKSSNGFNDIQSPKVITYHTPIKLKRDKK